MVFLLVIIPTVASANSGSFPAVPISGMQISYSIGGATANSTSDQEGNPAVRTLKGPLGTGFLQAVGTIKTSAKSTDVLVVVTIGSQSKDFKLSLQGTASQSYNVALPIPAGATSGTVSINMTGKYSSGNQETTQTIVVNGLFGEAPPAPPSPPSQKPPDKTPDKTPEKTPDKNPETPPKQPDNSPRWWPRDLLPSWPGIFSKTTEPPPVAVPPQTKQAPASEAPGQTPPASRSLPAAPYESVPTGVIVLFFVLLGSMVAGIAYFFRQSKQKKSMAASAASHSSSQSGIVTLQGISGHYSGQLLTLQAPLVFGRDPAVSQVIFPVEDIRISRRHAIITYEAASGSFLLQDVSSNGTFLLVQGELSRIDVCRLKPGDYFCLADSGTCFLFAG